MFLGGDAICQLYINKTPDGKSPEFSWRRAVKMTALGTFYVAPFLHIWYGFGPARIAAMLPHYSPFTQAFITMCIDQTAVMMPYTFALLYGIDYLDHFNGKKSLDNTTNIFPTVMVNNWLVWAPATLINFRFVPGPFRVLFANGVGFFWNIYVSYAGNRSNQQESKAL